MPGNTDDRLEEVLAGLRERPPLSEDEFRFRLEPLRSARGHVVSRLLEALEEEGPDQDLVTAVLHELAEAADAERLAEAFGDETRAPAARAEIGQLLAAVAADRLAELLDPESLAHLSALSLETLLERYQDRAGLGQIVSLYRSASPPDRRALLDAIEAATRSPTAAVRLGAALDPLFPEEGDPELRELMIRRVAARPEAASAATLSRWVPRCHGEDRRRVKEALRRLARFGIRSPGRERPGLAVDAWMSGVDGTGCYSVGLSFPGALGLRDLLLACIGVDAGLRSVSLLAAVENGVVADVRDSLEQGQGIPVAAVDPSVAFRHVHEARRRCESLGRPLPPGYATLSPYLDRPLAAVSSPDAPAGAADAVAATAADSLLEHPAYGSWLFFPGEIPPVTAAAVGDAILGESSRPRPASVERRLRVLAHRALDDLERSQVATRLVRMLHHQAIIHRVRAERSLAARAHAAAREIEERGLSSSRLAARLMERSLRALHAPGTHPARPEVRETLKRRIEARGPVRGREVLVLNLAEALFRQLEDRNEILAPVERLTLEQIERLSLAAAEIAADEFTRDTLEQAPLPGLTGRGTVTAGTVRRRLRSRMTRLRLEAVLEQRLAAESALPPGAARPLAAGLGMLSRWFAEEVCLRRCGETCLKAPMEDARRLFYAPAHPASPEPHPDVTGPAVVVGGRGLRQDLRRRLEARLDDVRFLTDAGAALGRRGESAEALARLHEIGRRLRAVRLELDRVDDDPSSIYSSIEETHALDAELAPLSRRLLAPALAAGAGHHGDAEAAGRRSIDARLRRALRRAALDVPDAGRLRTLAGRLGGVPALGRLLALTLGSPVRAVRAGLEATLGESAPAVRRGPLFPGKSGFDGDERAR